MNTQLIVDNLGNIVFLQAGFLGAQNDATNFIFMERIGPGTNCDMPPNAYLLADKEYADVHPLLTPFRAVQIRRMAMHDQIHARRFNRRLSRCRRGNCRTYHKTCKDISCCWKSMASSSMVQPVVVELASFLAQRHVVLFDDI